MKKLCIGVIFVLGLTNISYSQDTLIANTSGQWAALSSIWSIVRDSDNPGNNTRPGKLVYNNSSSNSASSDGNDVIIIPSGSSVTANSFVTTDSVSRLEIYGTLILGGTGNRSIIVTGDIIVHTGGQFIVENTNTLTHQVTLHGDLTNFGAIDFEINSSDINLTFGGGDNSTITEGIGSTWDLDDVAFNKSSSTLQILNQSLGFTNAVETDSITISSCTYIHDNPGAITLKTSSVFNMSANFEIMQGSFICLANPDKEYSGTISSLTLSGGNFSTGYSAGGYGSLTISQDLVINSPSSILNVGSSTGGNLTIGRNATLTAGTVNVGNNLNLTATSAANFYLKDCIFNVGTGNGSSGTLIVPNTPANNLTMIIDRGATLNIGSGVSYVDIGDGVAGGSGYVSFKITGGSVNIKGRFSLNDNADSLVINDLTSELSIDAGMLQVIGGADPSGLLLSRGTANLTNGKIFLRNPLPFSGNGATFKALPTLNSSSDFSGITVYFGDGIATASGSSDGFDTDLDEGFIYGSIVVNNPLGLNRHTVINNTSDLQLAGNLSILAGSLQIGDPSGITNSIVRSSTGSGIFTLASGAKLQLMQTNSQNYFPGLNAVSPGFFASYIIDANSAIEFGGTGGGGTTPVIDINATGQQFGHLIISGSNDKNFAASNVVRGNLSLLGATLIAGTNLTLASGKKIIISDGVMTGTLQSSSPYTIEYIGVSKAMGNAEFTGTGNKSLVVNMDDGEILTLNTSRSIEGNLSILNGIFSDGGNTLTVNGDITNSAVHSSTGSPTGKIVLNNSSAQIISGSGNGVFGRLEIDNINGVVMTADHSIDSALVLTNGVFDIGDNHLTFGYGASVRGTGFNANKMIRLNSGNGSKGVKKFYNGVGAFTWPVGVERQAAPNAGTDQYTPATITINQTTASGAITLQLVDQEAPAVTTPDASLTYYWKVTSTGFANLGKVFHRYVYADDDSVTVSSWIPARLIQDPISEIYTWNSESSSDINGSPNQINLDGDGSGVAYIDGIFTAGQANSFGPINTFYSMRSGDWDNSASGSTPWSIVSSSGPEYTGGGPDTYNPVVISSAHTVTIGTNSRSCAILSLNGVLDIGSTTGHNFRLINGTGRIVLSATEGGTASLPDGAWNDFISDNGGEVEFTGFTNYNIFSSNSNYHHLKFSGTGIKTLPNTDLLLSGDLTITQGTVRLSNGASGNISVQNINISAGSLHFTNDNARTITVNGQAQIGTGGMLTVNSTGATVSNRLILRGDLLNNGVFDMINGSNFCDVIFEGATNNSITGSGTTLEFERLSVDKGASQNNILTISSFNFLLLGSSSGSAKALTLKNGTLKIEPGITLPIILNSGGDHFSIPTTARLWVNGSTVQVTALGASGIDLKGKLQISGGTVDIGTSSGGLNNLQYSGSTSELEISGGTLSIGAGLFSTGGGSLNYIQSSGNVTIGRWSVQNGHTFEISSGSITMSGGILEIVRQHTSPNYRALYLNGISHAITGGTFRLFTSDTPSGTDFRVHSTVPFWDLEINKPSSTDTVYMMNDWKIKNDFSINISNPTGNGAFNCQNYNLEIGGNFTKDGSINNFTQTIGTGTDTFSNLIFNGSTGIQTIDVDSINIQNITINNSGAGVQLASGTRLKVRGNWTSLSDNFDANGCRVTFDGASNTDYYLTGNVAFFDLVINESSAPVFNRVVNSGTVTINNVLSIVAGGFNIGTNNLILTNTGSAVVGSFDGTRKITVAANGAGVTKYYSAGSSSFTFPVGTNNIYTPASITVNGATSPGTITVIPVASRHPSATSTSALSYYWKTSKTGFGTITSADHLYVCPTSVAHSGYTGSEYQGGFYNPFAWITNAAYAFVNSGTYNTTFSGLSTIDGEFTAGQTGAFGTVTVYYSRKTGVWNDVTAGNGTWSTASVNGPSCDCIPTTNAPVIIGGGNTITVNVGNITLGRMVFDNTDGAGSLNISSTGGHAFTTVTVAGNPGNKGTIVTTLPNNLPTGNYTDFVAADGGTIEYSGTNSYTLVSSRTVYNHLTISNSGVKTLGTNITINGSLKINTGSTFNLSTYTANRTTAGDSLVVSGTLQIGGTNTLPLNYAEHRVASGSTIEYYGSDQAIVPLNSDQNYYNLTLNTSTGTSTKTLGGTLNVRGNLTIGANTTLSPSENNYPITLGGNWVNSGTYSGGSSSVILDGASGAQSIANSNGEVFSNLSINNSNGVSLINNLTVTNQLTLTSGTFSLNGQILTLNGTVNSAAGTLSGSTTSNLSIGGTGALGTINFTSGAQILNNLTINRSNFGTMTLGTPLTLNGMLTLTNGKIIAGSHTLRLSQIASQPTSGGGAGSFVDGRLIIDYPNGINISRIFPIGSGSKYRPVTITGDAASSASVQVRMVDSQTPNYTNKESNINNVARFHYFGADLISGSFSNSTIRLSFNTNAQADPNDQDLQINDPSTLVVARSTGPSAWFWSNAGGSGQFTIAPAGFVTSQTTFLGTPTYFAIASTNGDQTLPAELSYFKIQPVKDKMLLNWKTESEIENAFWLIQRKEITAENFRSINENGIKAEDVAGDYYTIETVKGQGTKNSATTYSHYDNDIQCGKIYAYRLIDVAFDGTTNIHESVIGKIEPPKQFKLNRNFPNPFNPNTKINYELPYSARVKIEIYNILGQKIKTLIDRDMSAGYYQAEWNGTNDFQSQVASGVYLYRMVAISLASKEKFHKTYKMTLLK